MTERQSSDLNNNACLKWSCRSPGLIRVKNYEIKYQNQPEPGKDLRAFAQCQKPCVGAMNMCCGCY